MQPHTDLKNKIKAIDVHTHINHGSKWDSANEGKVYTAYLEKLLQMNQAAHIEKCFVPLLPVYSAQKMWRKKMNICSDCAGMWTVYTNGW